MKGKLMSNALEYHSQSSNHCTLLNTISSFSARVRPIQDVEMKSKGSFCVFRLGIQLSLLAISLATPAPKPTYVSSLKLLEQHCELRPTIIAVAKEDFKPRHIELHRCQGTCNNFQASQMPCVPTSTLPMTLDLTSENKRGTVVLVLNHTSCGCHCETIKYCKLDEGEMPDEENCRCIKQTWQTAQGQGSYNEKESTTLKPEANTTHFPISKESSSLSKQKIFVGAVVFGCVVFAALFGIGIYCYQRKKLGKGAKYGLDCSPQQSEMAVEYIAQDPCVVGSSPSCVLAVPMMSQESRNLTKVSEVDMSVGENWEIDRELINLQEVLGEGAFGRVMKAEVFGFPNMPFRCHVAVKMIKENATEQEHTDLLSELEVMKTIGKHKNIINLIGACTQGGPLYVVVEFAPNGNLRQFLKERRPTGEYPTTLTAVRERWPLRENGSTVTYMDLVSFSYQVCRGMEYLSSKRCIHRDLAARNVLVAEDHSMKIADFGLCRDVHLKGYYRKTTDGLLPVMWMAVESLFDRVYSTQSDVWSFGILLWEMVTFGGSPYPGVPLETLCELLKSGYRMKKPLCCPENMYQIMLKCWQESPMQRPTFEELVKEFDAMLVSLSDRADTTRQLEEDEIHQEASFMIPLATRASNSALVSPSTPRNTGGTEHEMENDGRDNDSASPDRDTNVIWEVCNPSIHMRQLKRDQKLQSPKIAGDKKETSDATFHRLPIETDV